MPKGDHIGKKFKPRPTKLVEVQATPAQLGAFLRDKCDVVIVGENHVSRPSEAVQDAMFESIDPYISFVESSPSSKKALNDRHAKMEDNWGSTKFGTRSLALNAGTEIVPVDIEHCKNAESVKVLTIMAAWKGGEQEALFCAMETAMEEIELSGRKVKAPDSGFKNFEAFEKYLDRLVIENHDVLSPHNVENLSKTREACSKKLKNEPKPFLEKVAEFFSPKLKADQGWYDLRDEVMAKGIEQKLGAPNVHRPASIFNVGMLHNEGVEEELESRGFKVANVKVVPSNNPRLHGKVYQNLKPSSREDAEWIVTVFDAKQGEDLKEYSFPGEERCRKPTGIPKAKMVLEEVSK